MLSNRKIRNKNKIQIFGIAIIIIGIISAIICGCVYSVIPADYLADNLRYPDLYPLYKANKEFNWICFLTITFSSFLSVALFYCLGSIVKAQENVAHEIKIAKEAIINNSNNQNISHDQVFSEKPVHTWIDSNGNKISE
jgi:hypothetical protein